MKVIESGIMKYRQLQIEGYLQRVPAEQGRYAEVCEPPKMAEIDIAELWNCRIPNGTYVGVGGAAAQLMGNLLSDCQTKKREGCVYNESLSLVGYVGDGYFINIVHC